MTHVSFMHGIKHLLRLHKKLVDHLVLHLLVADSPYNSKHR